MDDERLERIPLLAVLDRRARARVLKAARTAHFAPGEQVIGEGDPATRLYVIVSGHAQVIQHELGLVATLDPGEFFGELALIEGHGRTASVVAKDELECLVITGWEFKASLREHPEMALPMLETIVARLHTREHRDA